MDFESLKCDETDRANHDGKTRQGDDETGGDSPIDVAIPEKEARVFVYMINDKINENTVLLRKQGKDHQVEDPILEDEDDVEDRQGHLHRLRYPCSDCLLGLDRGYGLWVRLRPIER